MDFTISVMVMDMCIKSFLFIVYLEGGNFLFLIFSLEVCYHILDSMSPILVKQTNRQKNWSILRTSSLCGHMTRFSGFWDTDSQGKNVKGICTENPKLQNGLQCH